LKELYSSLRIRPPPLFRCGPANFIY
jgi:hypothetical protein